MNLCTKSALRHTPARLNAAPVRSMSAQANNGDFKALRASGSYKSHTNKAYANWNRDGLFAGIHFFAVDIRCPETGPHSRLGLNR